MGPCRRPTGGLGGRTVSGSRRAGVARPALRPTQHRPQLLPPHFLPGFEVGVGGEISQLPSLHPTPQPCGHWRTWLPWTQTWKSGVLLFVCVSLWARRREGTWGHVALAAPAPGTEVPAGQEEGVLGEQPRGWAPYLSLEMASAFLHLSRLTCEMVTATVPVAWSGFQSTGERV